MAQNKPRYAAEEQSSDGLVVSQAKSDYQSIYPRMVARFKQKYAEKSWRIELSQKIRAYNKVENKKLSHTLDRTNTR